MRILVKGIRQDYISMLVMSICEGGGGREKEGGKE